jgi:hypothetical protein
MKSPKSTAASSPGRKEWDVARGVAPKNAPAVINNSFVSDPRGNAGIVARHGVEVRDNRSKSTR